MYLYMYMYMHRAIVKINHLILMTYLEGREPRYFLNPKLGYRKGSNYSATLI